MQDYDELWERVKALDDLTAKRLLYYLMGYCTGDKNFLEGVEAGLARYENEDRKEA